MRRLLLGCTATLTSMIGYAGLNTAEAQTGETDLSPGQISVRLSGRVNWYAGIESSSLDNSANGDKSSTDNFLGYMRFYPGFDGVAANGLHYGSVADVGLGRGRTECGEVRRGMRWRRNKKARSKGGTSRPTSYSGRCAGIWLSRSAIATSP
jgi:hypothetical protein